MSGAPNFSVHFSCSVSIVMQIGGSIPDKLEEGKAVPADNNRFNGGETSVRGPVN